ncbi:hypothetical protein GCM10020295_44980 [Streptomyces cinereospinus]
MRADDHRRDARGGIPDGLLIGILAFLLSMTLLVWSATGLAAWLAHGSWPQGVTFPRTPLAMRHLIGQPQDLPGAWPQTPGTQLSGYGLFWGLLIGQLMVLFVLAMFVLGTVARWRAGRARRRAARGRHRPPSRPRRARSRTRGPRPPTRAAPVAPDATEPHGADGTEHQPSAFAGQRPGGWESVLITTGESRRTTATEAIRDADGPALVVTSSPDLWQDTKDARSKLGPTLLYDPTHTCDTPARLHWSPVTRCEDKDTATARAIALLTPPSAPPHASTRRSPTPPAPSCAATCTPPPWTTAPSATSTAGPRAPRSRKRYAPCAPIPRPPRAPPASSKRPSPHTPNAATWPTS